MPDASTVLDGLILAWLVFTWVWGGEHRRCRIDTVCSVCEERATLACEAHRSE